VIGIRSVATSAIVIGDLPVPLRLTRVIVPLPMHPSLENLRIARVATVATDVLRRTS